MVSKNPKSLLRPKEGKGLFYRNHPESLEEELGVIDKIDLGGLGHFVSSAFTDMSQFGLHIYLFQPRIEANTMFTVSDPRDMAYVLRELGVSSVSDYNAKENKNQVVLHKNGMTLYGLTFPE